MRSSLLATGLFLTVLGCATTAVKNSPPESLLPPEFQVDSSQDRTQTDYFLMKIGDSDKRRNTQWWVNYRRAHMWRELDPLLACEKFSDLARDKMFPLQQLANLRAWEACPKDSPLMSDLQHFNLKEYPAPLQSLAIDVALSRSLRDGDKNAILQFAFEKSKRNLPQGQKVQLTQLALSMAEELKKSNEVSKLKARLFQIAPRLDPNPKPEQYLKVAYDFRRARQFTHAESYYQKVISEPSFSWEDRRAAMDGLRLNFKNQRRHLDHIAVTQKLVQYLETKVKRKKTAVIHLRRYHEAMTSLIRAQWTAGQGNEARENIVKVQNDLRGRYPLAEVFWIRARMFEESHNFEESLMWVDQALKESPISKEFREKLLWYKAWNLRKLAKHELAIESFHALKSLTDNEYNRTRYSYWLARSYKDLKQTENANAEFNWLLQNDSLGYYGILAHREMSEKIPAQSVKRQMASVTPPLAQHLHEVIDIAFIEWLSAVGEEEIAREYLDAATDGYKKHKNQDQETWLALLGYYARAGQFIDLFEKLGELPSERRNSILELQPTLLFPKPYYTTVKSAAESHRVQPELIYSIMRQESAFNTRARSPADAFGLMQILPEVAKVSAEQINIPFFSPEDLYNPQINIPIGAAHLRELLDMYKGKFIPAIASYNAAHTAIKNWIKTRYRGDAIEFIEDIPYEETRNYVRLVLRNMIFYSLMENEWQPIAFPEWTLRL